MEKTTKNQQAGHLQLASLLKEIEKAVKATQAMQGEAGAGTGKGTADEKMALSTCGKILPTLEGIRKRLDAQAEERVLAAKVKASSGLF